MDRGGRLRRDRGRADRRRPSPSAWRREGIELVDGQTAEICLALDDWVAEAAAATRARASLLLIDYGAPAAELYDPVRRRDGTLRAYVRHQVHDDPYRHVGRQDLTAHVDVTAVERAAHAAGLTTIGITTQAEALVGLGIEDAPAGDPGRSGTTLEAYTLVRPPSCGCSTRRRWAGSGSWRSGADWPAGAPPPPLGCSPSASRRRPPGPTRPTRANAVLPLSRPAASG